jgi:hypothetical protein
MPFLNTNQKYRFILSVSLCLCGKDQERIK